MKIFKILRLMLLLGVAPFLMPGCDDEKTPGHFDFDSINRDERLRVEAKNKKEALEAEQWKKHDAERRKEVEEARQKRHDEKQKQFEKDWIKQMKAEQKAKEKKNKNLQDAAGFISGASNPMIKPPRFQPPVTVVKGKGPSKAPAPVAPSVHPPKAPCFISGTLVHTPNGPKEIENIRVGNLVLSFNQRSREIEPARVLALIKGERADLVEIRSPHGSVVCSENHPFFTQAKNRVEASRLRRDDRLLHLDKASRTLASVRASTVTRMQRAPVSVHSFTVENNSNYFVGPDAILCHNTPPGGKR